MDQPGNQPPAKRRGRPPGTARAATFAVPAAPAATALAAVQAADAQAVVTNAASTVVAPAATAAVKATAAVAQATEPTAESVAPAIEAAATPLAAASVEMIEAVASPAVYSDPIPAARTAPPQQGPIEMASIAPNVPEMTTEKLQSMFGDVGARFKASVEKSSKMGEELVELTKGNVEAVVASARVVAKGGETLGQDAAEYTKKSFESAVAAMKSFASVKSPTELFQLQSEFAKASFDSAVAEASRFSESMMKLAGEATQPLSTRYAVAAEKIKASAL